MWPFPQKSKLSVMREGAFCLGEFLERRKQFKLAQMMCFYYEIVARLLFIFGKAKMFLSFVMQYCVFQV